MGAKDRFHDTVKRALEKDGWTIRTADRKPSTHFEHTVAVRRGKPEILTTFEYIESSLNEKQKKLQ